MGLYLKPLFIIYLKIGMIIPILFAPEITFICFILVIMDMVYTVSLPTMLTKKVIILVIMDMVYTRYYHYENN